MKGKKSGQINVYFILSSAIFISMVIYLIYALVDFYPERGQNIRINSLYSKAYLLSELMIKDQGYPQTWDENNILRLGLASSPYELSRVKITRMQSMCDSTNPAVIARLLNSSGLPDERMMVTIEDLDENKVLDCNPFKRDYENLFQGSRVAKITRVVTLDNKTVKVTIYVS